MSPEEKLAALLRPAKFQTRSLSERERRYFELRLRRVELSWRKEWRFEVIVSAFIFACLLLGMWFTNDLPWWGAFFFLGIIAVPMGIKILGHWRDYLTRQREFFALLESGTCDELRVATTEVWVIENLDYGTCWYACATDDMQVIVIDGGQYDFFPRLPATEFSLRVYKHANGNIVEPRVIPYGERIPPTREFSCSFTNSILDLPAYTYAGTLLSFCESLRGAGIDLEETCPANAS